jgi:type II secretory pathway pseudopilin PulG
MTTDRSRSYRSHGGGFTLVEATLALVLLGMAAAGVLLPFVGGVSVQTEGLHRTLAAKLANDLIEQVVATPYDSIVATYNYTESQGQLKDASGTIFTDPMYAEFSRSVTSEYVYVNEQGDEQPPCFFILATVRVYYRGAEIATVNRLISE